jgi:hypothetical protein
MLVYEGDKKYKHVLKLVRNVWLARDARMEISSMKTRF